MAIRDDHIEERDFGRRCGDDSPPLMTRVPEPPPSHWGKLTSRGRTCSMEYLKFLMRKEAQNGKQ
jgi:hypothetical protein